MNRQPLRAESPFKIGLRVFGIVGPRDRFEIGARKTNPFHVRKIIRVVRGQAQFTPDLERCVDGVEERIVDQAAALVFPFGPRVGKHHVEDRNRTRREQMLNGVGAFQAQDAKIFQILSPGTPAGFADPAQKPFDAQKIPVRELGGHGDQERAFAAADIDFHRSRARESKVELQRLEIVRWNQLMGGWNGRLHPSCNDATD